MNIEDIKLAKELYKFKMSLEPFREVFVVGNKIIPLILKNFSEELISAL